MSVIAQAITDRQSEIDRLQAEIKALTDVEQILGASSPPPARSTARRSPRKAAAAAPESKSEATPKAAAAAPESKSEATPKAAAAAPESKSEATPERKRRELTAAQKKAVSERMTAYWAERRKKAGKK